jgi:methylphosphotriester-DNA--protein-cysteine methyltransferase
MKIKIKTIDFYLLAAIGKCRGKEARSVSEALKPVLPDVIKALHEIILDNESDRTSKRWAVDTISAFWRTLLTISKSETHIAVKRMATTVRANRVRVAEQQTAIKIHQVRAEADKKLAMVEGA